MEQLFDALITSKMRVRILMRLFLNAENRTYLRELVSDFGASPGHVNKELGLLKDAGLLQSERDGRQINYRANTHHPLFPELHSMVRKSLGMDRILESIIERLGNLETAFLLNDYAMGKDSGLIDLVLVGDVDLGNLNDLVAKTERYIDRKIQVIVLSYEEYIDIEPEFANKSKLLLWSRSEGVLA
ncbi:MAG: ArsR family transcriptional regulator [Sedimenticola sp.]